MFLKIVRKADSVDSLYECKTVHTHWSRNDSEGIRFSLDHEDPVHSRSITVNDENPVMIYIMNNEGKTVERIEHKPHRHRTGEEN